VLLHALKELLLQVGECSLLLLLCQALLLLLLGVGC
jgi:hypothetical protein